MEVAINISLIALLISFIALLISVLTLYITHLKPFALKIQTGCRFALTTTENPDEPNDPTKRASLIIVPIVFANVGSRKGYVNIIALRLTSNSGKEYIFRPFWTLKWIWIRPELKKENIEDVFSCIFLNGKESISKIISFVGYDPFNFPPGEYRAEILTISTKDKKWKSKCNFMIKISPEMQKDLLTNHTSTCFTCESEKSLLSIRNKKNLKGSEEK